MQIVYLNDYYEKEEAIIKSYGIPSARVNYPFQGSLVGIQKSSIFRGPKMKSSVYSKFIQDLEKNGGTTLVSLDDFAEISDAIEYTRCFGKYAPKVVTFDIKQAAAEISKLLIASDLKYPLFVRTDIESAAKYVGVDACTLKVPDVKDIEKVLEPIHNFITNAGTIIMKEIVPVKKINGKNIEYRAIVVNGEIVCFDYDSSSDLPSPKSLSCAWQFQDCINIASEKGLHGAYFVDFGISENETLFVVECKNIINGTIKNINAFAEGLAKKVMD